MNQFPRYFSRSCLGGILHGGVGVGVLRLRLVKLAQDVGDDGDELLLLVLGVAVAHILENGVEGGDGGGAQVENHDGLALGQLKGLELLDESLDAGGRVGDGGLAEGAGGGAEVLEELGCIRNGSINGGKWRLTSRATVSRLGGPRRLAFL